MHGEPELEGTHIDPVVSKPPTSTPSPPGILIVTLHEGVGLSTADDYKELSNSYEHDHDARGRPAPCRRCNFPYALLEYEKWQVSVDSFLGTTENPMWVRDHATHKFDVSRFTEFVVRLYLRDPNASSRSQDISLGVARVDPFDGLGKFHGQWLNVQNGTGKIRISLEYMNTGNKTLETTGFKHLADIGRGSSGRVSLIRKEDTQRPYAEKRIRTAQLISQSDSQSDIVHTRDSQISHPFIVPLTLAFQAQKGLHLLSPFVNGGHLFSHLQKERCCDVDRSRFYAAEILCALEYLHEAHSIFSWLKPRNVLLDSLGHIVLCGFGLSNSEIKNLPGGVHGTPEYPAPELLLGQDDLRAADWWTLGVFLDVVKITGSDGLPLFYDEESDEIRRKILDQPNQLPEPFPIAAKDILTKLLNRRPQQRLGANEGASEIKAHPFFDGIDWHKLLQRKYEPAFKYSDVAWSFKQHGVTNPLEQSQQTLQQPCWFSYSRPQPERNTVTDNALASKARQVIFREDDGWDLIWEEAHREIQFYNHSTGEKQLVPHRLVNHQAPEDAVSYDSAQPNAPSRGQMQDALEAALEAGHNHIVSQLLDYGMDLNIRIFGTRRTSPLEWAVEHGNAGLVKLFLGKGADANFADFATRGIHRGGPALIKAVERGNQELSEVLVRKTDRVASTRALGLAIDQRDIDMVRLLLANGVPCYFREADRPHPQHPLDNGCYFRDLSEPEEFIPPLVRAVKQGNVEIAQLLLSHGADANVGYHDLSINLLEIHQGREQIMFSCGRVVELAMELRQQEMVRLLLASGADIGLLAPIWPVPGHDCRLVPRDVYQRVTAGLRTAPAAARKEGRADPAANQHDALKIHHLPG
ncbi:protein kinase [Whalleya microplaca]|nr:protein kinase [Whalleya microplaca]